MDDDHGVGHWWRILRLARRRLERRLPFPVQRTLAIGRRTRLAPLLLGVIIGAVVVIVITSAFATSSPSLSSAPPAPAGAPSAHQPDLTITMTDALLRALIQQSIQKGQSPVRLTHVQVTSGNGLLTVHGDVVVLGQQIPSSIEMRPVVQNGALVVHVVRSNLGPLPVPSDLGRLAERPIDARVAAATSGLAATLTDVQVTNNGLTVTAKARVAQLTGG